MRSAKGMGISRRNFLKFSLSASALGLLAPSNSQGQPTVKHIPVNVNYRKLANSSDDLQNSYDVVVIGSGYGGAVMASRLAEGRSLAVLERGPERPPGTFAEKFSDFLKDIKSPRRPLGLFELNLNHEMDVVVGNGLGGTSLINAGAVVQPDLDIFRKGLWPSEIVEEIQNGEFARFFSEVRQMLQAQSYDPSRMHSAKVEVHKLATQKLGEKFQFAKIAVNLYGQDQQPGVQQPKCIQCGNCCSGCNTGAKNTLNMNYLPLAKRKGAKIFTQIEVDYIQKISDHQYLIHCDVISDKNHRTRKVIEARHVIVAAGTLGSTKILMRSQQEGLSVSAQLGRRFSGNGDVLGLSFNTAYRTDAIGFSSAAEVRVDMRPGTVINGIADYRPGRKISERFVIEEGTFPGAFTIPLRLAMGVAKWKISKWRAPRVLRDVSLSKDIEKGALNYSMVYLGMGHDRADGRMLLDRKSRLRVHWPQVVSDPIFPMIDRAMKQQSQVLGGNFVMNPRTLIVSGKNLITVHPLGGCVMSDSVEQGVVNHLGMVFRDDGSLHQGLYVMDGSVIPTALGVNPLLTISALAERAAEIIKNQI